MTTSTSLEKSVDKRGERIRAMFAAIAPRYDLLNHLLSLNIDRSWRRTAVRRAPPDERSTDPILDVCTGTGDLALAYAQAAGSDTPVIGVDFCPQMLEIARRKGAAQRSRVEFRESDAQSLPFPDDHFQLAAIAFGLRNVADPRTCLAELIRVVKPGARVAILEFSRPTNPILGALYLAYFKYLLPRIGDAVAPNRDSAYHYLPASVLQFPDGPRMVALLEEMGLVEATYSALTAGVATLYVGRKQRESALTSNHSGTD
jgi:demethylmenaquinone methyltransferase/2-methoxy-6-polyprenyl-1,4-benzoquinol methylase